MVLNSRGGDVLISSRLRIHGDIIDSGFESSETCEQDFEILENANKASKIDWDIRYSSMVFDGLELSKIFESEVLLYMPLTTIKGITNNS